MVDTSQIPACQISDCVNGPEPHPYNCDVEKCQPGTRVNRPRPLSADHAATVAKGAHVRSARNVRPLRDDPTETNVEGGSQSVINETFTTMPLRALRALSQLQRLGDQKYGPHNWRKISETDHLDHGFAHMLGHSSGDETEDHLLHAAWRLFAALEVHLTDVEKANE